MRELEELYTILFNDFNKNRYGSAFICSRIAKLFSDDVITPAEYQELMGNFIYNRPKEDLHVEFYKHRLYSAISTFWFGGCDDVSYRVRLDFLEYLIKNHVS